MKLSRNKYLKLSRKIETSDEKIENIKLEKKLNKYYSTNFNSTKEFENSIKTAFRNKKNKNKINRTFGKIAKAVTAFACVMFLTYFTYASPIMDYILENFNFGIYNVNNSGIMASLKDGNLQNVYMDYIEENGVKVKISYVLINELNLYLVFDVETDFDLYEKGIENVDFDNLRIVNENMEEIYIRNLDNTSEGSKIIILDNYHFRNVVFVASNEIPKSKELCVSFSKMTLYKNLLNKSEKSDLFKDDLSMNFDYKLKITDNMTYSIKYDIKDVQISDESIVLKKVLYDETGLNLLIQSNDKHFSVILGKTEKVSE